MSSHRPEQIDERMRKVEEHIRCENAQDIEGVMATFGENAEYEELAWGERYEGRQAVWGYYQELLQALPDLNIDVRHRHATPSAVVLEVTIHGTHRGKWRGLPPTGRRVSFPLCAIYTFDKSNQLAGERIYYDRTTVLRQLGLHREPTTQAGRLTLVLNHPLTLARAGIRTLMSR